jgi:hypothetical protein
LKNNTGREEMGVNKLAKFALVNGGWSEQVRMRSSNDRGARIQEHLGHEEEEGLKEKRR